MTSDERRNASLLFASELVDGLDPTALDNASVRSAVKGRPAPPLAARAAEWIAVRLGWRTYWRHCVLPALAARREVLGSGAGGSPRFLVRVDEFPHVRTLEEPVRLGPLAYQRFHRVLADHRVAYLLAGLPRIARDPYNPDSSGGRDLNGPEVELLAALVEEGVEVGVHGLDHRTRDVRPRRHSELVGLTSPELDELLDTADRILSRVGIPTKAFVPPFNRFSAAQYAALARRYAIVCGGPETILSMGFQRTPQWRGEAIYVPAYAPLYGRSKEIRCAVEKLVEMRAAIWVPIVLHWSWELEDNHRELARLAELVGPRSVAWSSFHRLASEAAAIAAAPGRGQAA